MTWPSAASLAWLVVAREESVRFMQSCLMKYDVTEEHARLQADNLAEADYRGHYSHGLNRLDYYLEALKTGNISSGAVPSILSERVSTAWVDGNNALGAVVGHTCMNIAIRKAKEAGVSWVTAKGSTHFGIAGWYSKMASDQQLVGMVFTNTSPCVLPTRSKQPATGTNPISVAAPGLNDDSFQLDMATSTVSFGKVEIARRKGDSIPETWGCDVTGHVNTNPSEVVALLPLGGVEQTGGYKGSGLSMMVDVFCGILSGSNFGRHVPKFQTFDRISDLGQCFIAVDPSAFAPGFETRMQTLMDEYRNLPPVDGEERVLVPGDPERHHMAECDRRGGIPYHPNQITHAMDLATRLGVTSMQTKTD